MMGHEQRWPVPENATLLWADEKTTIYRTAQGRIAIAQDDKLVQLEPGKWILLYSEVLSLRKHVEWFWESLRWTRRPATRQSEAGR